MMKRFLVELTETWVFPMVVEANSEKEAQRIATDRWNGSVGEDGREREEPISVTERGGCAWNNVVVQREVENLDDDLLRCTTRVGNDGRDINQS